MLVVVGDQVASITQQFGLQTRQSGYAVREHVVEAVLVVAQLCEPHLLFFLLLHLSESSLA